MDYEGQSSPGMRGRGCGRGRGRGRASFSTGVREYNGDGGRGYGGYGGFEGGRGYGGRDRGRERVRGYHGRGREYGGGSMQPEWVGYTVYNAYGGGAPSAQGRGRGRARGRGHDLGVKLDGPIQSAL